MIVRHEDETIGKAVPRTGRENRGEPFRITKIRTSMHTEELTVSILFLSRDGAEAGNGVSKIENYAGGHLWRHSIRSTLVLKATCFSHAECKSLLMIEKQIDMREIRLTYEMCRD